jgi:MFS transporter, DHA2 family, methylenomycin A resistance protein
LAIAVALRHKTDAMTMTTGRSATGHAQSGSGWLPLIAVCLGYFLVILDVTVINVALPSIAAGLHAGVTVLQWIVDGYTLAFAGLLLFCGGLSDRVGGKRVFLAGLAVFTVASAGCALAPSAAGLVGARLVQGTGAALMVPASLTLLRHAYPDQRARARAFGVWGMVAGIAAAAGPVLGGGMVSLAGWRSVFFINLPFGVLGYLLTARYVAAPAADAGPGAPARPGSGWGLDLPAQVAGMACLAGVAGALIEAGPYGWASPLVLGAFGLAAVALPGFLVAERHSRAPMVPLELFRSRQFDASAVVGLLLNLGFYGMLFLVPLYFERSHQFSPAVTGLAMLPMAAMPAIASPLGGRAAARYGPRLPMAAGFAVGAAGLAGWLLAGPAAPYWIVLAPLILTGAGTSFTMPAATAAIMEAAPAERGGAASGVFNAARQTGSAIGVALTGSLAARGLTGGLHVAAIVGAVAFLAGALISLTTR